jgi:hypothetical protein
MSNRFRHKDIGFASKNVAELEERSGKILNAVKAERRSAGEAEDRGDWREADARRREERRLFRLLVKNREYVEREHTDRYKKVGR